MEAMKKPMLVKRLEGHKGAITAISFCNSSEQIATSSSDHSVMVWNHVKSQDYRFLGHTDEVTDVCFSHTGDVLVSSSLDKTVRLWSGSIRGCCKDIKLPSSVRSVHFSPDSKHIVTGSDDKIVKVWDVSRRKFETSYLGHYNWVRCTRFYNNGKNIASCSDDKTVRLFDRNSRLCFQTFKELNGSPSKVDIRPGDNILAAGLSNGSVVVYDLRNSGQPFQRYNCHNGAVTSVAFDYCGNYLISASVDSTIQMIDIIEARPVFTLEAHTEPVTAATLSTDGHNLATGGKQLLLWETRRVIVNSTAEKDPKHNRLVTSDLKSEEAFDDVNGVCRENNSTSKSEVLKSDMPSVLSLLNRSVIGLTRSVTDLEKRLAKVEKSLEENKVKCSCSG